MTPTSIFALIAEVVPKIHLDSDTEQSTYAIARLLMRLSHWVIDFLHLSSSNSTFVAVYAITVFIVAFVVGWIVKYITVAFLRHIHFKKQNSLYDILVQHNFFLKICNAIPPLVFLILIQFTLYTHASIASLLTRLSWVYVVFVFTRSMTTLSDCIWEHLDAKDNKRKLPLHGVVQIVKIFLWIVALILTAAILLDKSPGTLLAGLGAFAAVLMLVFKDSILGVVAGVQLAQNDSLHVGDWIAVPGNSANGTVSEVSLTAVKIINWDLTVTTVAPYSLIANGFTNYRNMQQSNTRRICRSYYIDADSIVQTTDEMLQKFRLVPYMSEWIDAKIRQQKAGKVQNVNNSEGLVDGTIETNLGVFRAYLQLYLQNNPDIAHDPASTCFVTTLAQTSQGVPLQIYCFTATSSWLPYEGIQASVFEHIAMMMHYFNLYIFEYPSGRDTIIDGYMSPGKNPEFVFGMPYPFFNDSGNPNNPGIPPQGLYAQSKAHSESGTIQTPSQVWGEPTPVPGQPAPEPHIPKNSGTSK